MNLVATVEWLPGEPLARLGRDLGPISELLEKNLEREAERRRGDRWLDVASPAHGRVNVLGARRLFRAGHVEARDSDVVVVADNCRLSAKEHYHIKRVSLDTRSLCDDEAAVRAFAEMLVRPSDENIRALQEEVNRIAGPPRDPSERTYREQLSEGATTRVERADVVFAGDGSRARSTVDYHVRETVVPLAELLRDNENLVRALAGRGDMKEQILHALRGIADDDLLANARDLDDGRTSARHSSSAIRTDLGAAVMIGAGNRMIREREVDAGRPRTGNLDRLDRVVRKSEQTIRAERTREDEATRQPDQVHRTERGRQPRRRDERPDKRGSGRGGR